jgi:aspartate-semialdehyde dehydrogenase
LPRLDALFIAGEDSDVMNRIAGAAAREGVLTLVHGAMDLDAPVLSSDSREELDRVGGDARIAVIPRTCSYVLAELLGRVSKNIPTSCAVVTLLLPARELGEPGAEELHQQTVNLLNFRPIPTEVFGEQLAFNVQRGPNKLADNIAREVRGLLRSPTPVTVQVVRVPVFHGYASSIWVGLERDADESALDSLRVAFRSKPFQSATGPRREREKEPTPVGIESSSAIHVGSAHYVPRNANTEEGEDEQRAGTGSGLWLWAVADESAYDPAKAAVDIAKALL